MTREEHAMDAPSTRAVIIPLQRKGWGQEPLGDVCVVNDSPALGVQFLTPGPGSSFALSCLSFLCRHAPRPDLLPCFQKHLQEKNKSPFFLLNTTLAEVHPPSIAF